MTEEIFVFGSNLAGRHGAGSALGTLGENSMVRNLWLVTHRTIVRISDISAVIKGADCIIYAVLRNKDPIALTYELTGHDSLEEKFTEFKNLLLEP